MVSLEDFFSTGSSGIFSSSSPQFARFLRPEQPRVDVAALSRPRELELAGAGEAEVERARQFERARGATGIVPIRAVLEDRIGPTGEFETAEDTQPRGVIESIGDIFQRGVSATVGGISGLLGAERLRETVGEGALFETPEGRQANESNIGLALRRFAEGLSGEEQYRAADFGILAYDRETTALPERAMKATAGFILDTIVDPLTYMSLGGSIFGRARGAQRVFAWSNNKARETVESALSQLPVERRLDIIARASDTHAMSPSMIRERVRQNLEEAFPVGSVGRRRAQQQIAELETKFVDPEFMNDLLLKAPTFATDLAADIVAANSAVAYRVGSSSALKNYLKDEFGDAGMTVFRAMPADIQGGVRFRLPFSGAGGRDPKILFRIPGTEKLSGITNRQRQWMRNNVPGIRNLAQKANGRWGDIDMQLASAAYASRRNAASKVFGAVDPETRAVFWYDNEALKAVERADVDFNKLVSEAVRDWEIGKAHVDEGVKAWARQLNVPEEQARENFLNAMDAALEEQLINPNGSVRGISLNEVFGETPTPGEIEAHGAATMFASVLNRVARELEETFPGEEGGKLFSRLTTDEEYWPRMVDYMNEATRKRQPGGSASSKIFKRENFFSVYTEEGGRLRSMSPRQIRERYGANQEGELFITDPVEAMVAYLVATTKIIQEERMFQHLKRSGLIVQGQPNLVPNVGAAREAALQAANELRRRQTAIAELPASALRRNPEAILNALDGWKRYGRTVFEDYARVDTREVEGVSSIFRSADGTQVVGRPRRIAGLNAPDAEWLAQNRPMRNKPGQYLTRDGKFTDDVKRAARFRTRQDAEAALNAVPSIMRNRTARYQDEAYRLLEEFQKDTVEAFAGLRVLDPSGTGQPVYRRAVTGEWEMNPMHPSNIPFGEKSEEYISQLVAWMNKYGEEVVPEQFRSLNLIGERYRFGAEGTRMYRELAEQADATRVRGYMQQRFENEGLFAPATLVEPIRRLYRVRERPEGFAKWVDEYYRPFYSVQKALMTAQRGPGYVLRNIQGGMWNAWLFGVRGVDFATSARVNKAKIQAVARGKAEAARRASIGGASDIATSFEESRLAMEFFQEILKENFGDARGRELFRAWETFAAQGLDGRTVASKTRGTQAITRVGEPEAQLRRLAGADLGWYENAADYLAARSRWAQLMGGLASESEDYLRFATYLRGVRDFDLEDGGMAAALYVKGSQFDYSDLSDFEIDVLKMIIPFYTWSRNNIPLQARAIMTEPGKVNAALRINDAFRDMFGEEDDPEEPMPVYVRERLGWRVRTDMLKGPFGDALAAGVVVGEPLLDVNRLFRTASGGQLGGVVNLRDIANQINPIAKNATELLTAMETSTGGLQPRREETPGWLAAFRRPFAEEDEELESSARALRFIRNTIPPIGIAERLFPQALGNERMQRRWYTSLASSLFGLPVSTLDPFQTAAELRAEEQRNRTALEKKFGNDYAQYTGFVRDLLSRQITPQEMQWLKLQMFDGRELEDVKVEELDQYKARDLVDLKRRLERLADIGVDRDRLDNIVRNFTPRSDFDLNVRGGLPQPLTPEILQTFGLTPQDVEQMTTEQRQQLINEYFN